MTAGAAPHPTEEGPLASGLLRALGLPTEAPVPAPRASLGSSPPHAAPSALVREVARLAVPAIAHMLLVTLVFLVDRVLLGRYAATSLASLQISSMLVWTFYAVFGAFSTGTLALSGRFVGEARPDRAASVALASLAFALGVGVVVATTTLVASPVLLPQVFPRASAEVLGEAQQYLAYVLPTLPLAFVEASAAASLQSAGDTRTPLYAAVASNVINLVLSGILVFGLGGAPELGIVGAAIGTAVATVVQALALLGALLRRGSPVPLRAALAGSFGDARALVPRLLHVSVPAFLEKAAYNGGYVVFVTFIALLGDAAMAANQALVSVEAICFLSADGFGIAAGALVAQKLGQRRPDEAALAARVAGRMAMALLTAFGLVFLAVPRLLMGVFGDDASIVEAGAATMPLAALAQPFMAYAIVMRMALRGAGATRTVLAVTLLGTLLVRLPVSYGLAISGGFGLVGIWAGSTAHWVFEAVVLQVVMRRGRWREVVV